MSSFLGIGFLIEVSSDMGNLVWMVTLLDLWGGVLNRTVWEGSSTGQAETSTTRYRVSWRDLTPENRDGPTNAEAASNKHRSDGQIVDHTRIR